MRTLLVLVGVLGLSLVLPAPATAQVGTCSTRALAGRWIFGTNVGRQALFPAPAGDITALGTMDIDRHGNVIGEFDLTVEDSFSARDIPYSGKIEISSDCRGTLEFVTGAGSKRTDSVAVVDRDEMWGMSLDSMNLWNYRVRRIRRGPANNR